jgi:hypothetical protein
MLRLISRAIALIALLALAVPVVLVLAGLAREPLVPVGAKPTPGEVARAKTLLSRLDPRGQGAGELRSVEVLEQDLAFALDYAVGQVLPAGAAIDLHGSGATVSLTAQVPDNPLGHFFNLRIELAQLPGGIDVEGLRFGNLQVPEPVAKAIGWLARTTLQGDEAIGALLASVNGFRVTEDRLVIVYQLPAEVLDRVKSRGRALLIDEADRKRLLAYAACIASVTGKPRLAGKAPLTELLGPVFAEARSRSAAGGDAAAENRAAIVAMMLYAQGMDVARVLGEPPDARYRGKARPLTLQGRTDFAQHFLISAGIAAAGGSRLADAVGLFKELDDSRAGSGFSFTDLAADRAGVRFAETATGPAAHRVQGILADGADESIFMPKIADLPEFIREDELVRRFGDVGSPRYRQVADDIERRIGALAIHRGPP